MLTGKTERSSLHDCSQWTVVALLSVLFVLLSLILHKKCQNSSHYIIAFASPVTFSLWAMDCVWVLPQNSAELPGGNIFYLEGLPEEKFKPSCCLLTLSDRGQRNIFALPRLYLEYDITIWTCLMVERGLGKRRLCSDLNQWNDI